ncbi:MAG: ATPase, T2SS/T4P/T4SS family [Erysipelotrichaceae bacterium]|nr:ATPase, T2SS/T4P/T4SS family [Erysipelotrichaceae bacterium]
MAVDVKTYVEQSFLSPLLALPDVTDISYNGKEIYYVTNRYGRAKSELKPSEEEVEQFLRQIANQTERQLSFLQPILDVSFGPYRLNAVNRSIARWSNEKTYTFSLRVERARCAIEENPSFFAGNSKDILQELLWRQESLVIGGLTGSGKTELQKWCLLHLRAATKVIVVDNVEELDLVSNPNIDLTMWIANEQNAKCASFSSLIKNALRNNPDYIIVAEARGAEMLEALTCAMSGHPILTTIHAKDVAAMPGRIARLAMMGNPLLKRSELLEDVAHHFSYYAYVAKERGKDGSVLRYLKSIARLEEGSGKLISLFERSAYVQ